MRGNQAILEENFYRVVHDSCPSQNVLIGTLTLDLFAVANLFDIITVVTKITLHDDDNDDENSDVNAGVSATTRWQC